MPFKDPEKRKEYKQRPDVNEKHKEYLKTCRKIKIECGCGGGYFMKHKGRHERTKIGINNLKKKEKKYLEKWRNIEPLI